MNNDLSKLPSPPSGVKGLSLSQLPPPPSGVKGLNLSQINKPTTEPTTLGGKLLQHGKNVVAEQKASDSGQISAPSAGLQMAGELGGAVSDVVGAGFKALGVDKLIGFVGSFIPTFDPNTNKITSASKLFSDPKYQAQLKSLIQPIENKWEAYTKEHPEASGDINALMNIASGTLNALGVTDLATKALGEDILKGGFKNLEDTVPARGKEILGNVKTSITSIPKNVKGSISSLLGTNSPEELKTKITDLFSSQKARVGDVNVPTASKIEDDKLFNEINTKLDQTLKISAEAKNTTIAKFAKEKVPNLESYEKDFTNKTFKLRGASLSRADGTVWQNFQNELMGISRSKPTLEQVDQFIDNYQWAKTQNSQLQGFIRSTVHDINESTKTFTDTLDGGAYRKANDIYSQNVEYKNKINDMSDVAKVSGENVKPVISKMSEADLANIKTLTGIPVADRLNLVDYIEKSVKTPDLVKNAKDAVAPIATMMGKRQWFNRAIDWTQNPEGRLFKEIDIQGNVTKLANSLKNVPIGLDKKQLAVILMMGQLQEGVSAQHSVGELLIHHIIEGNLKTKVK